MYLSPNIIYIIEVDEIGGICGTPEGNRNLVHQFSPKD